MSGEEYGAFRRSAVRYPLTSSTANTLLADADPSIDILLDYLSTVIDVYVGDRLRAQAALAGVRIVNAVAKKIGVEISAEVLAENFTFPLLAVYRISEAESDHTVHWRKDVAQVGFAWVLPALTGTQIVHLAPIRRSVSRVIARALHQPHDPNFRSGVSVWDLARWQSASLKEAKYGSFELIDQKNGSYRALTGMIELIEREFPAEDAFQTMTGTDVNIDVVQSDGTVYDDFIATATAPAPTITNVTPSSGTKAGGTPVTIAGTNFRSPMTLSLGGVEVPTTFVSSTVLTATTPAHAAYPTFMADVIVTDFEGQSAQLSAGFTFTSP